MELMMPREKWTDDRLDEFKESVEDGYARLEKKVDTDIRELKGEMNRRFAKVDDRLVAMSSEFNDRFDRLNGSLLLGAFAIIAALVGNFFF